MTPVSLSLSLSKYKKLEEKDVIIVINTMCYTIQKMFKIDEETIKDIIRQIIDLKNKLKYLNNNITKFDILDLTRNIKEVSNLVQRINLKFNKLRKDYPNINDIILELNEFITYFIVSDLDVNAFKNNLLNARKRYIRKVINDIRNILNETTKKLENSYLRQAYIEFENLKDEFYSINIDDIEDIIYILYLLHKKRMLFEYNKAGCSALIFNITYGALEIIQKFSNILQLLDHYEEIYKKVEEKLLSFSS